MKVTLVSVASSRVTGAPVLGSGSTNIMMGRFRSLNNQFLNRLRLGSHSRHRSNVVYAQAATATGGMHASGRHGVNGSHGVGSIAGVGGTQPLISTLSGSFSTHTNCKLATAGSSLVQVQVGLRLPSHCHGSYRYPYRESSTLSGHPVASTTPQYGAFKLLYDSPYSPGMFDQGGVLRVGPLLHRENLLDPSISDVYVRTHYNVIYNECFLDVLDCKSFFFTGTPGIGKSCLRTYFTWRMIQRAKEEKQTCAFWLGRSPEGKSRTFLIRIKEGHLGDVTQIANTETGNMCLSLDLEGIPVYGHFDISEGNTREVPKFTLGFNCYYTSPNELAWKELSKLYSRIVCLPCWSLDELEDFYVQMGCPEALFFKLQALSVRLGDVATTTTGSTDDASTSGSCTVMHRTKSSVYTSVVARSLLRSLIENEASKFGYVPRNMFLSKLGLELHEERILRALPTADFTLDASTLSFASSMHHRLISINPLQLPDGSIAFGKMSKGKKQWLGSFVGELLVNRRLQEFKEKLDSAMFASRIYGFFRGDLKFHEILSLGCLMLQPSFFKVNKIGGDDADFSFTSSTTDFTTPLVRCVTNQELLEFAGDLSQRGLVTPFNPLYPCIDGVGHFDQGLATQGRRSIVTAFIQVTVGETKPKLGSRATVLLERLVARCKQGAKGVDADHKIVFVWMVKPSVGKEGKTLHSSYTTKLSELGVKEYFVYPSVDEKPDPNPSALPEFE